jgi:hypothetical protein
MSILESELAETIGAALVESGLPLGLTLIRETVVSDPAEPWNPPVTESSFHPCLGFADAFEQSVIDGYLVLSTDVKIVIVATSLAVEPVPGDRITIRGKTYHVIQVSTDPAQACWTCQGRV